MNRLPLNALRVFEAVAGRGSFAAAAGQLNVTPAAISQQIRALEDELGVRLFERNGTRIAMTAEAAQLLPGVRRGFEELRRAVEALRSAQRPARLTLSSLPSFLQRWLLPRLPEFQAAHPEIDLRMSASTELVDLAGGDFVAAIRFGGGRWPGLRATHLLDDWLVPVCEPRTLERLGPIRTLADLRRRPLLHSDSEPWSDWVAPVFGERAAAPTGVEFDDSATVAMAAERGQGTALVRWSLAAVDIEAGRLVVASEHVVRTRRAYYLVTTADKAKLPQVRAFRGWLVAAAEASPKPMQDREVATR